MELHCPDALGLPFTYGHAKQYNNFWRHVSSYRYSVDSRTLSEAMVLHHKKPLRRADEQDAKAVQWLKPSTRKFVRKLVARKQRFIG